MEPVGNLVLRPFMFPFTDDTELAGLLNQSDVSAFEALYQKYHKAVYTNITRLITEQNIAEDTLQDVFMALWEHREQIDASKGVANWLFVVSYNKSMRFLKKKVNERIVYTEQIAENAAKEEEADESAIELPQGLLNDAVAALPPRKRQVFELCRLEGKSYAEAASILGVSAETIKQHLKETTKFLRNFIFSRYPGSTFLFIVCINCYL